VSYERLGDVQVAQGDLPAALTSYQIDLATMERLAKSDPGNAGWQSDLALSYASFAKAYRRYDDNDKALEALRQGQAIMAHVVELSPENASWKRYLAWFDDQIATVTARQWKCTGISDVAWDEQIVGCTNAIQSGRYGGAVLARVYNNRGNAHKARSDVNGAIADYNEAIRLDPQYALAYNNRGNAYRAKGDADRAIADYNRAIAIDPLPKSAKGTINIYNNRGNAYKAKGDIDHAIADYNEAIRLDPNFVDAYFDRGRLYLYIDALPKAVADLNQATELSPKSAYAALWLDIAKKHSDLPSHLMEATAQIDMTKWPAPVIRLYLGQMTSEVVLDAAANPDADTKRDQVCEANFYTAELVLHQGKIDDAVRLLRLAAADCPKTFTEYQGAVAELKALGVNP
jgi:tetratricopeptide (TPR) repeat protein